MSRTAESAASRSRTAPSRWSSCWPTALGWCSARRSPSAADPANAILLADPSVSRTHARVVVAGTRATLEDAGSTHGTWLDGHRVNGATPLHAGSRIHLGDVVLSVEGPSDEAAAGKTIVVPAGSSVVLPAAGAASLVAPAVPAGARPRVAPGWALKRLEATEGERRYVLRELKGGGFVRMSAADARLFELLDGSRMLPELVAEAERLEGPAGPGRLVRLLVDLGDRGLLEGVRGAERGTAPVRRLERLFRPRERDLPGAGAWLQRTYRRAGWLLFTSPALAVLGGPRGRRYRRVHLPHRQALWHAVRRREQDRHRRARLPPRALRRGRRPRDRARIDPHLVRPPRRARRPQVGLRLPVRLRRHVAGVVRAAPPANRGERCRAG